MKPAEETADAADLKATLRDALVRAEHPPPDRLNVRYRRGVYRVEIEVRGRRMVFYRPNGDGRADRERIVRDIVERLPGRSRSS